MSDGFGHILSIDTAMSGCSACVLRADGQVFTRSKDMPRGQAVHLVPMMNYVVAKAGINHADLSAIVTTNGPGAFTGLRIGLSTAKATGLALGVPVFGITTLQALALDFAEKADDEFTVLVETRRDEFYVQSFDERGLAIAEAALMIADDIPAAPVFIGDAVVRYSGLVDGANVLAGYELPNVEVMAKALLTHKDCFTEKPEAVYLRGADVSKSKRKQRVIAT